MDRDHQANGDQKPHSLEQPWWLGTAKRQHVLLRFINHLHRNRVANRRRGSRGASVKQFSARRSRERFRCQRGATQPQLEVALRVIGIFRFQF
jgi:hypothetical protein